MNNQERIRLRIVSRMTEPDGETHETKNARRGLFARTADGIVIDYDDEQDGERAHITLEASQGRARMTRKGMTGAALHFRPGEKINSAYVTIYGEIPVAVDTRRVLLSETDFGGELLLDYDVYMGGDRTASALLTLTWRK